MLHAASAQVDITPPVGASLSGYFTPRKSIGIHDDLFARALLLDDGITRIALVSCDLKSIKAATVREIRALVEAECGIPPQNILVCCSHTHTGPYTSRTFNSGPDADYLALLPRLIAGTVIAAHHRLVPATIGIGVGSLEGIAFNRRYRMKDGTVRTNPGIRNPDIISPAGPIDPSLGVIRVNRADGSPLAIWVNYAVHSDVIGGNIISADFAGSLSSTLQRQYGSDTVVLYANGACGDINHINVAGPPNQKGFEHSAWMGRVLAAEALRVAEMTVMTQECALAARTTSIDLPLREITPEQIQSAQALSSEAQKVTAAGGSLSVDQIFAAAVLRLVEERQHEPTAPAEIQAIRVAGAVIISNPSELFVEYGLQIKTASPYQPCFVVGYANGMVGYVPTRQAFTEGGYEIRLARSSKLVPEAGESIVAESRQLLSQS